MKSMSINQALDYFGEDSDTRAMKEINKTPDEMVLRKNKYNKDLDKIIPTVPSLSPTTSLLPSPPLPINPSETTPGAVIIDDFVETLIIKCASMAHTNALE